MALNISFENYLLEWSRREFLWSPKER
jgi:hypothetical protein